MTKKIEPSARLSTPISGLETPRKPKYKLEDLLAQMPQNAKLTAEDKAWLDMPPVGKEKI